MNEAEWARLAELCTRAMLEATAAAEVRSKLKDVRTYAERRRKALQREKPWLWPYESVP